MAIRSWVKNLHGQAAWLVIGGGPLPAGHVRYTTGSEYGIMSIEAWRALPRV